MDLDYWHGVIIFGSFVTAFDASSIFDAARAAVLIGSSLKLNHYKQIQLAQIDETHCRNSKIIYIFACFLAVGDKPGYDFRDNDDVAFEAAGIYSSVRLEDVPKMTSHF